MPRRSGLWRGWLVARMKRRASWSGTRRWPPAVREPVSFPSSTQRFTELSLTPMTSANSLGDKSLRTWAVSVVGEIREARITHGW